MNNLIICSSINERDNFFMNKLSQIVSMELNMFHLTMCNKIFSSLNCTLIFTIEGIQGLYRKSMSTPKLLNPYFLYTCMNYSTIFFLCNQDIDDIFLLPWPNQWSSTEVKHISISEILIIIVTHPTRVGEANQ
jgi:hypothetical protein